MKRLFRLDREETLVYKLVARVDPATLADATRDALLLLAVSPFTPTAAFAEFKGRFEPVALASRVMQRLDTREGKLVGVGATLRDGDSLEHNIHISHAGKLSLRGTLLLSRVQTEETAAAFVGLLESLGTRLAPLYARAHPGIEMELIDPPIPSRPYRFAPDRIEEVFWLNVWGPEIVATVGRDRVLATPAFRVTELAYGGVLAVMRPMPVDYTSDETHDARARALIHLRPDLDEVTIRARLAEHARKLAPVERAFDPDVAELFDLVLEWQSRSERPTEIARLNAVRPPAVSEVRDPPLPAQGKAAAAIDRYAGFAEQLVALLRKDIPEIDDGTPAVLARIDWHLWHFNFAGDFKRADIEEDLVPAVGAYLGQVMVEHLGGTWVPRRTLDESQVVVGGKAYLPFLRARHALASRDAQLEYSLTQLYRVAERGSR